MSLTGEVRRLSLLRELVSNRRRACAEKDGLDANAPEELLLDMDEEAKQHSFYMVAGVSVSPDANRLMYGQDTVGTYTTLNPSASGKVLVVCIF